MARKMLSISEAELEIMKILWKKGEPVNTQTINHEAAYKNWKRTTISTLLARLVEKGAVKAEKQGNSYFYTPLISAGAYRRSQTRQLIKNLYNGSAFDFAVSFFKDAALSEEDIRELRSIIDEKEE